MGKIRTEPRQKEFLSEDLYQHYLDVLKSAHKCFADHHVFYDLDVHEEPASVRKAIIHVADKEGIDVQVRLLRGKKTLTFNFKKGRNATGARMSSDECRKRILSCLENAAAPMKKNEIIKATQISPSTWNIRIRELVADGRVKRHGDRRDTTYSFVTPLA